MKAILPSPKIYIVVPVYNRLATTCRFLDLISKQTYKSFAVVLVDDSSTDGTSDVVKKFRDQFELYIIKTKGNAWWGGCVYKGLEEVLRRGSKGDCSLLMNDDIIFSKTLLADFISAHRRWPTAVLGVLQISNGCVASLGSNMICWPLALTSRPYEGFKWPNDVMPEVIPIEFQGARATLYPLVILRRIGNIAYQALPHYHSDGELSYRAVRNGFPSYVVTSIQIFTEPNKTGLFNSVSNTYSIHNLLISFFIFKSINNLRHRWNFARLCCPPHWRYIYFISHVFKSFVWSLGILILGERVQLLRNKRLGIKR